MTPVQTINEILDYFQETEKDPGGDWAFPDDFSSLCLDFRSRDDVVFWLDIERNGTIRLFWRPSATAAPRAINFIPQ